VKENSFFAWLHKINALLFFILMLVAFIILIVMSSTIAAERRSDLQPVPGIVSEMTEEEAMPLYFSRMIRLNGSPFFIIEQRTQSAGKHLLSYSGEEVRNMLLINSETLATKWLFDDANTFIKNWEELQYRDRQGNYISLAIYIERVIVDTNGDTALGHDDLFSIDLFNFRTGRYVEIADAVQLSIDAEVTDDGRFILIAMQKDKRTFLQKFSLPAFELVAERDVNFIGK
jgi:hypothetical protein